MNWDRIPRRVGTPGERVVVQLSRGSVVIGAKEPCLPGADAAVTPQAGSAKQSRTSGVGRYLSVLRSCGKISDERHWAARRSFW